MKKNFAFIILLLILSSLLASQSIKDLPPLEDRWALIIGISEYKDDSLNLQFAAMDADAICNALITSCRFSKDHIKHFKNADATYDKIRRSMEGWLFQNTNENDKIVIFFSGHGTQDIDDNNDELDGYDEFLVPYDFEPSDISSAIRDDAFSYWIKNLKSKSVLIIFDSCYSGGAAKVKGFNHVKSKGQLLVDSFVKDIFREVPKPGVALLAACEDHQYSFEAPEYRMGLFTYYLVNSLNKTNDINNDQWLSINEIYDPLRQNVLEYSEQKFMEAQTPILISSLAEPFKLAFIPQEKIITPENNKIESRNIYRQAISASNDKRKRELLEEAIKYDPTNYLAYESLADTIIEQGDVESAIHYYELALANMAMEVSKARIYYSLSRAYERLRNLRLAFQYIKLALDINQDTDNLNQLARIYYLGNDYSNAINYYLKSIGLNARDYKAHFELARIYIQHKQYNQALKVIEDALDVNPDKADFYYLKGILMYYIKNNIGEAKALYRKFAEVDILFSSVVSLFKADRDGWLKINLDVIDRNDFIAEYYACAILCYEKNKDTTKSKEYYERLIKNYPFFRNSEKYKELQNQVK